MNQNRTITEIEVAALAALITTDPARHVGKHSEDVINEVKGKNYFQSIANKEILHDKIRGGLASKGYNRGNLEGHIQLS